MSEIREDIVTGNRVIIAIERGKRPHDFSRKREEKTGKKCPFCYGNEGETPPEVAAWRSEDNIEPDTPGWDIRVVPNKFAAVKPEEKLTENSQGIYNFFSGKGFAEVVIESPEHNSTLGEHSREHVIKLIKIIQERYLEHAKDKDIKYVQVFKNYGSVAGASLEHPHWQIISTPLIPYIQSQELKGAKKHFQENGECVYCQMIKEEKGQDKRIVDENEYFIAFCPYASRYPFETWILPKDHDSMFSKIDGIVLEKLTEIIQNIVRNLERNIDYPPYNLILHTRPVTGKDYDHYHWHIEILPRLTITAGFELGTGYFINPTPPELAAEELSTRR